MQTLAALVVFGCLSALITCLIYLHRWHRNSGLEKPKNRKGFNRFKYGTSDS